MTERAPDQQIDRKASRDAPTLTQAQARLALSYRGLVIWGVSFQVLWFSVVELASIKRSALAAALNLAWAGGLMMSQREEARRLLLMWGGGGALIGLIGDGASLYMGLYIPAEPPLIPYVPLWLITLWIAFAMFAPLSLNWALRRPLIAVAFGAIGGPLSYLAGVKWGAMAFGSSASLSLSVTGALWGASMYLAARISTSRLLS